MGPRQDDVNENSPTAMMFSDNRETYEVVMKEGVDVSAVIKTCQENPDPHDDEHSIFILEYEYEIDSQVFRRKLTFSINIVHIAYAESGGLLHTPKLKYGLDDFRNSMQPGQKLKIRTLNRPPYWFILVANDVMAEVMRHEAVWT